MHWEGIHPTQPGAHAPEQAHADHADLHLCRSCSWPFVVPECVLDVIGADRYVIELVCANCRHREVATHDEARLEALDRELDRQTADMHAALEVWCLTRRIEEVDAFARALHDDHILPEDF